MSDAILARRVVREHRRLVVPLTIALAVNIAVYAFVVYPLSQRVANLAQREASAAATLAAALSVGLGSLLAARLVAGAFGGPATALG